MCGNFSVTPGGLSGTTGTDSRSGSMTNSTIGAVTSA